MYVLLLRNVCLDTTEVGDGSSKGRDKLSIGLPSIVTSGKELY
jgi:hypothetical protein